MFPQNHQVVDVYWMCKNQVILAPNGKPVDILFPSIESAMNMLGVPEEERKELFIRVVDVFHTFIQR